MSLLTKAYWRDFYRRLRTSTPALTFRSASSQATESSVESLNNEVPPPGSPSSRSPSPGAAAHPGQPLWTTLWATITKPFKGVFTSIVAIFKQCLACRSAEVVCESRAVTILQQRRQWQEHKYTVRPADAYLWPDPDRAAPSSSRKDIIDVSGIRKARQEADALTQKVEHYKRESDCLGNGSSNADVLSLRSCARCQKSTCDACRHHMTYRIISTRPLMFADEPRARLATTSCDYTRLASDPETQKAIQIRLREHEEPYALAYLQHFAHRWHAYCLACFPRVPAGTIAMVRGVYRTCRCTRDDLARRFGPGSRSGMSCIECFEKEVERLPVAFEDEKGCAGRGWSCGAQLKFGRRGSEFKAVCEWCRGVLDEKTLKAAKEAWREGEGFERLEEMREGLEGVRKRARRSGNTTSRLLQELPYMQKIGR